MYVIQFSKHLAKMHSVTNSLSSFPTKYYNKAMVIITHTDY